MKHVERKTSAEKYRKVQALPTKILAERKWWHLMIKALSDECCEQHLYMNLLAHVCAIL